MRRAPILGHKTPPKMIRTSRLRAFKEGVELVDQFDARGRCDECRCSLESDAGASKAVSNTSPGVRGVSAAPPCPVTSGMFDVANCRRGPARRTCASIRPNPAVRPSRFRGNRFVMTVAYSGSTSQPPTNVVDRKNRAAAASRRLIDRLLPRSARRRSGRGRADSTRAPSRYTSIDRLAMEGSAATPMRSRLALRAPAGTSTSRLPFDCIGDTIPARSICSIRRAARL